MDILDILAQMERYGQIVAFAPHLIYPDNTVVVVKLHKMDRMSNLYYVVIWDAKDRTDRVWHSAQTWMNAAQVFQNVTTV